MYVVCDLKLCHNYDDCILSTLIQRHQEVVKKE